jgi:hypothetical protein
VSHYQGQWADFIIGSWISLCFFILLVLLRYIWRIWKEDRSLLRSYWRVSAAVAMSIYDAGNFMLLIWVWINMHMHPAVPGHDRALLVSGALLSFIGIGCKARVFTDDTREWLIVMGSVFVFGVLAVVVYAVD